MALLDNQNVVVTPCGGTVIVVLPLAGAATALQP